MHCLPPSIQPRPPPWQKNLTGKKTWAITLTAQCQYESPRTWIGIHQPWKIKEQMKKTNIHKHPAVYPSRQKVQHQPLSL